MTTPTHAAWVIRQARLGSSRVRIHQDAARLAWPDADHAAIDQHLLDLLEGRAGEATVLKDDRRSRVVRTCIAGADVVIKTLRPTELRALLGGLDHALGLSPAWREWRGAKRLATGYVRCVEPIAMTRRGGVELLILPAVDGVTLVDHLHTERDPARRMALAARIGQQIGRMTAADLVNRDHKARNLLIDRAAARGEAPPIVIDPAGLRERRSMKQIARMFALLLETAGSSVSFREAMRCLHEAKWIDPTLVGMDPLIDAAYRLKCGRAPFGEDARGG